jgi:type IV secretory pathway VirJ component
VASLLVGLAAPAVASQSTEILVDVPSFGQISVYRPARTPEQVVLFVSGDGGWNLGVVPMAERPRDLGALGVGIDMRRLQASLERSGACSYPAGALEDLSRAVQRHYGLAAYKRPILVGYSSGATLVYAAMAAAPPETFAGVISLGFCPDIGVGTPLCRMRGLAATKRPKGPGFDLAPYPGSTVPWMVLQGDVDQVCPPSITRAFVEKTGAARLISLPKVGHGFAVPANWEPQYVEAYRAVAAAAAPRLARAPAHPDVADLSLVEVPAVGPGTHADTLAVLASGDGGWAEIDRSLAQSLASVGIPVVGWSSLDYYWTARTPEGAARDLQRIIDHYTAAWGRPRVVLVGYSFGADVLPFLVNRLGDVPRRQVTRVVLLGASDHAAFEFHVADWFGGGHDAGFPTRPELARLPVPVTCVDPQDEAHPACDGTGNPRVETLRIGRGHHFSGEYERLAAEMLR